MKMETDPVSETLFLRKHWTMDKVQKRHSFKEKRRSSPNKIFENYKLHYRYCLKEQGKTFTWSTVIHKDSHHDIHAKLNAHKVARNSFFFVLKIHSVQRDVCRLRAQAEKQPHQSAHDIDSLFNITFLRTDTMSHLSRYAYLYKPSILHNKFPKEVF
jgi:hypothetical protein